MLSNRRATKHSWWTRRSKLRYHSFIQFYIIFQNGETEHKHLYVALIQHEQRVVFIPLRCSLFNNSAWQTMQRRWNATLTSANKYFIFMISWHLHTIFFVRSGFYFENYPPVSCTHRKFRSFRSIDFTVSWRFDVPCGAEVKRTELNAFLKDFD